MKMVFIVCLALTMLLGCGKLYTSYSTFNVQAKAIDEIEGIVHAAFIQLGYDHGEMYRNKKGRSYWKWVKDSSGRPIQYPFMVTFTTNQKQVIAHIESTTPVSTFYVNAEAKAEDLRYASSINEYLSEVSALIEKRLRGAGLKATTETKSSWAPMLKY